MAKKEVKVVDGTSKRAGYKRASNKRINQVVDKLQARARAVLRADAACFGKVIV
ncbi:hypothetical protein UGJNECP4_00221 [Escherichia phage UGJNEcP4]|nr:hypothetical protein UGJNECP3_00055 [Escherichia phage UGJNEcP3]CAH1616818.1 hypothetical protein UGJNECP4_00221 [Escherichia phage UGJNEcP4]